MTKRGKIRAASLGLGLLLVFCGLWWDARTMVHAGSTRLEYSYRRALNDLTDYVSDMRATLEKAPYVGTPLMQTQVSAKLLEQSGGAKAAMAILPFSQEKADKLSRFLSQTGDYALALARDSAAGKSGDEGRAEALASLEEYAGKFSEALQAAQARLDVEGLQLGRVESLLNNVEDFSSIPTLDDSFDEVAQAFAQFPALLYDGPFSDHIQRREPLFLKDREELSREEAAGVAASFLGCRADALTGGESGGSQLGVYSFSYSDSTVAVTRLGGEIAYFEEPLDVAEAALGYDEALAAAKKQLRDLGFENLRESYYVLNDNLCGINFCAVEQAEDTPVLCYPDLIKVTVELGRGGLVEYDAAGYLMNHRQRELSLPSLTETEAAENLSPLLEADSAALAVIPTPGLDEVLCWEFHCRARDSAQREFLVYVNAETGQEEQLYLLQKDDHGVLVR